VASEAGGGGDRRARVAGTHGGGEMADREGERGGDRDAPASWRAETIAVAAGRDLTPGAALNVPPTFASAFRDGGPVAYAREGQPTWAAFEAALGGLEGGHAVAFASGQGAIAAVVTEALSGAGHGAVVVHPDGAYTGTRALIADLDRRGLLRARAVDVTDTDAVVGSLVGARCLWIESPTNPMLGVADLPSLLAAAAEAGVTSVVDNTFATPLVQRPIALGADMVVHSVTKYLGGHSDLLMGAVVAADADRRARLVARRALDGAVPGVMEAYLALRGLRTLPVRLARQQASALTLAERLSAHRAVARVRHPGLATDPHHERAGAFMGGYGAMVSFEVAGAALADEVVRRVRLVVPATSLGGVETTIERRNRWAGEERVPPGLLRMSVGLEHVEDLWADLGGALEGASPP
jgi:cystathionine gamma-synthase